MQKKYVLGYVYAVLSAVIYGCMPLMAKLIYADGVNSLTLSFSPLPRCTGAANKRDPANSHEAAALDHAALCSGLYADTGSAVQFL